MNRQQVNAIIFRVEPNDVDKTLLVAETGDAAFERIFHHQFLGDQRAHGCFRLVAQLREIRLELIAVVAKQPFHAAGVDDDGGSAPAREAARHECQGHLRQVFQGRHTNQSKPMANGIENFIRSRQRAGVGNRLAFAHFRTAQLDHENWLILF